MAIKVVDIWYKAPFVELRLLWEKMSSLAGIIVSEGNITGWVGVELFRGKTWVGAGKIGWCIPKSCWITQ